MNEKAILKCSWFKEILKKIAFTIFNHSHVHPSSKQEYVQTNQFLSIRSSQRFNLLGFFFFFFFFFYDRCLRYKLVNIKKFVSLIVKCKGKKASLKLQNSVHSHILHTGALSLVSGFKRIFFSLDSE